MSLHDEYARITPYELALPNPEALQSLVGEISREAEARNAEIDEPGAFAMLGSVNAHVRDQLGSEDSAEAILQYASLVYQLYQFARRDALTYLVDTGVARALVEGSAEEAPVPPPHPSGYAQLPRNLFWIRTDPQAAPEAVDGFFWSRAGDDLHVLVAVGLLEGRPGFSVVPLPGAPLADAGAWLTTPMRPEGEDFATTLPGGELETLYSITTAGEVLKLAARFFDYLARVPSAVVDGPVAPEGASPTPSALDYRKVVLDA